MYRSIWEAFTALNTLPSNSYDKALNYFQDFNLLVKCFNFSA